jgi:hypothetical protein
VGSGGTITVVTLRADGLAGLPRRGGQGNQRRVSAPRLNALVVPDNGWQRLPAAASIVVMVTVALTRLYRVVTDLECAERTMRHLANHDQPTA